MQRFRVIPRSTARSECDTFVMVHLQTSWFIVKLVHLENEIENRDSAVLTADRLKATHSKIDLTYH